MKNLEVAWRRMGNSRLIGPPLENPAEVVRLHGAMQAQDYSPAKWSIAQRANDLVDEDVDRALSEGSIVRTHVLRPTWHFASREDIRWLLALTGPRVQKQNGSRYRELGLDARTLDRAAKVIGSTLAGGNRLTRDGIGGVLDDAGIDRSGQRLPYMLMHCELDSIICSGGLNGKKHTYALLDEWVPKGPRFDRDEALIELVRRYLTSHGPATVQDLRWWSNLMIADIKNGLRMLGTDLRKETSEGLELWSIASEEERPSRTHGMHLLQTYDELIVGYSESRYLGDPLAGAAREAWKARSLPTGIVLLDGGIAGHWRRTIDKKTIKLEVHLYDDLNRRGQQALESAAANLGRFLGRDVTVLAARI